MINTDKGIQGQSQKRLFDFRVQSGPLGQGRGRDLGRIQRAEHQGQRQQTDSQRHTEESRAQKRL